MAGFILLALGSYLLGSVPLSHWLAKWYAGVDLKQYGSGNVGMLNLARATSKWLIIPVFIFDMGKGVLVVYVARQLGMADYQQVVVSLAALIGHCWPVFLGFSGGRGVLTALGIVLVLSPWLGLIGLALAIIFIPFHQLAFGVFLSLVALPPLGWFVGPLWGADKLALTIGFVAISLIMIFRRLSVPRSDIAATMPKTELLVNRFLFDRDIRDREAWVHRKPAEASREEPTK